MSSRNNGAAANPYNDVKFAYLHVESLFRTEVNSSSALVQLDRMFQN
jgi:hypothetical protein